MARFELAANKTSLHFTKEIIFLKFSVLIFLFLVILSLSCLYRHTRYFIGMAARRKQKQASNPYNLRKKVEIPVELQIENDSTFLHEFSQSGSVSRSDTDSDIESIVDTLVSRASTDSEDNSPVPKHTHDFKSTRRNMRCKGKINSDPTSEVQPDQSRINQRILSHLDAIGKRLSVIENSASVASIKVKNSDHVCGSTTASSSLPRSSQEDAM